MSILAIDIGKTGARAGLFGETGPVSERVRLRGSCGLADPGGAQGALETVQALWAELGAGGADLDDVTAIGVGAAGLTSAPEAARSLLRAAAEWRPGLHVVLASDIVTSHVGALAGEPGTVLAVGTGSVALALRADGGSSLVDGWGFLLGDDGSGYAVGRAGLAAAVQHDDGRGGSAVLHDLARARYGELRTLPQLIHAGPNPAAEVAAFAPDVAAAAAAGDRVSRRIWKKAAEALVRTAVAAATAADDGSPIAFTGGLLQAGKVLADPLRRQWSAHGPDRLVWQADGDAVDGAALLAARDDLPHEAVTLRVGPTLREGPTRQPQGQSGRPRPTRGQPLSTRHTPAQSGPPTTRSLPSGASTTADVLAPAGFRSEDLGILDTEAVRDDLDDLDLRSNREILDLLAEAEETVQHAVAAVAEHLAAAVDTIVERLRLGGRLFYVGAGTPGRLACMDASELPPTFGISHDLVVPIMAGGEDAVFEAAEGAEDDEVAACRDLDRHGVGPGDAVVGLTASGRTPYVLSAVTHARAVGAATIGVSNNAGTRLSGLVDHPVEVLTGPEVVAGSTRLKAGTSQKLVLNSLSTTVMIRLGKTHGPWMVDLRATNDKLRARAIRMVVQITGADEAAAEAALADSRGHVKTAIVALTAGVGPDRARELLAQVGGSSRGAIAAAGVSDDLPDADDVVPLEPEPLEPEPADARAAVDS